MTTVVDISDHGVNTLYMGHIVQYERRILTLSARRAPLYVIVWRL